MATPRQDTDGAHSAADRYRRATFNLARAAKEVYAAATEAAAHNVAVVQQAQDDLREALQLLGGAPAVRTQGAKRKPAKHVERANAGPAVRP